MKAAAITYAFIDPDRYDVTGDFLQWARPLIGGLLPRYTACMG